MAKGSVKKTSQKKTETGAAKVAATPTIALVVDDGASVAPSPAPKGSMLKKKQLIERVAALVGGNKKAVKDVVEATLTVLGEAMQSGEGLNVPPFGKARVAKSKGEGAQASLTVKLRGAGAKKAPRARKQPLAEVGEDS